MKTFKIKIEKIILFILIIIVSILVISAVYINRYKFEGTGIARYSKIMLEKGITLDDLADEYTNQYNKTKFVSEIKRMNNLDSIDYIPGNSTLIIPIIESE
jgi:hypothetical protein